MLSLLYRIWQALMRIESRFGAIVKELQGLKAGQQRIEESIRLVLQREAANEAQLTYIIELLEPGPAVKLIFSAELEGQFQYGVTMLELRDDQKVTLSIQPVDKKGNPAKLDGAPEWFISNSDLLTLSAADDGMSAVVTAIGPLGSSVVSVKADADLGEGVTPIVGALEVLVVGGSAVTLEIKAGTPEDQEAAAEAKASSAKRVKTK